MAKIKPNMVSLFHMFSLGYVVETNHKDCFCEPVIKVLPLEYMSNEDVNTMLFKVRQECNSGTIEKDVKSFVNNEKVKLKVKKLIQDSNVNWKKINDEVEVERQRWIPATWLSLSSYNEFNPPCVNRGDLVIIYKYGDMNSYFWEVIFKRTSEEHKTGEGSFKRYIASDPKQEKIEKEVTSTICTDDISFKMHCSDYTTNIFNYLEMMNGEFKYIDQLGNMISVGQDSNINLRAMHDLVGYAKNNMLYTAEKNMDLVGNNLISMYTRDLIAKAKNGANITAGHVITLKAGAITLQGNVVINGNLVVTGSASPGSCPCCCVCPSGGGGGDNVPTAKEDTAYMPANKNATTLYNDTNNEKTSFINKIKNYVKSIIKSITDKVGTGN